MGVISLEGITLPFVWCEDVCFETIQYEKEAEELKMENEKIDEKMTKLKEVDGRLCAYKL